MSNIRSVDMAASLIDGEHMTVARKSHSTNDGRPNVTLIDGVHFLPARSVTHTDGHVTEIIRSSWPEIQQPLVQVHVTTTLPGRVRGWGLHQRTTDRLFVMSGLIRLSVLTAERIRPATAPLMRSIPATAARVC
jgi:dTDP-4-dehydrorhamnose 3,5-epimerase